MLLLIESYQFEGLHYERLLLCTYMYMHCTCQYKL